MEFEFVRKLVYKASDEELQSVISILDKAGIECFIQCDEQYQNLTEVSFYNGEYVYVSAADVEYARKLLQDAGLIKCLCSLEESEEKPRLSELEKAEEAYFKKRRQQHMECLIIIVGVIIFLAFQYFFS